MKTAIRFLDANGEPIRVILYTIGFFNETVGVYAVTPEQYQIVRDLIDSTHSVYSFDENILSIVSEECAAYFSGAKTIDDPASFDSEPRIFTWQSRIKLGSGILPSSPFCVQDSSAGFI